MAAAELKLQVGLDLAFFRQQLALLGTTATGYSLPINIDRLGIQQEITKLGKNISNRSYTLKVKTTAAIAEAEVDKLKTALDNLQGKEVGIKITGTLGKIAPKDATKIRNDLAEAVTGGAGKKILVDVSVRENAIGEELRAVRKALNEKITPKNGKILVAASIRNSITNEEAKEFRESVKRKIGNIIVDVTGSADQLKSKEAKGIRTSLYQSIISNGGKIKIPATLTIANSEVAAFQKAVNSQFAGITVKIKAEVEGASSFAQGSTGAAGLEKHLQTQGLSGGNYADVGRRVRLREQLKTRSKAQLLELAKQEGLARYSKLNKDPLIERLVQEITSETAERILGNVQNMLRNAGGGGSSSAIGKMLDTFARGVFHMLGMDPAAMMAAQKQKLLPPSISWPASAATPPSYQGKPGTMLPGAPAPTLIGGAPGPFGLLPRTTRAGAMGDMMRMLSQGAGEESPGALAKTTKARIDEIINKYLRMVEVQVGKSFDIPFELKKQLNTFSYLVQALRDADKRTAQMQMPITKAIGGTAFGSQKYLPTALGDETKKVLRDAAHAFLNVMRQEMRAVVYQVGVQDLGNTIGRQAMLPGRTQAPLMLPAAGGTTPRSQMPLHAVSTGAYVGQPGFMQAPSVPAPIGGGAPPTPPTPPGGGRGGFGSFGGLGGAMPNVSLPGAGLVKEVGDQFGYAAQQVLLFGTTYKALAFLTDFPSKVGEAVAQLQTFRNTLQAITPNADEFQKSNQFILDTVDKYNTPLQSARDGFTNLYASMAPAGFKGDEIRNIFAGISQGAATFGMSADKVDRVNYAFAQMASKGQVMSEELKGQLGDVLPGAVAIFAQAAGFKGPQAMVEFTKAMEAGRYKGEAMKQLLINVGIVMKDKFAKGAEGAAQNFQGQMNAMGNATKKLYETFAPAGNLFAGKIIAPFTKGLTVITDGFNAFFTGVATKTAGGFALSQELEKLRPTFKGIADNVKQLLPVLQSFATTLLGLGKILLQVVSNPFVGYLARVYLAVLPLTIAIQALNLQALIPMIASFLRAIPAFAAYSVAAWNGASRTKALGVAMQATGQTSAIAGGQVALLSNTLKAAFVGTVIGAVVIGIGMIIERIMTLSSKMEEARASALKLGDSIKGMSQQELQIESNKLGREEVVLNKLQAKSKGKKYALLSDEEQKLLERIAPGLIVKVQYKKASSDELEPTNQLGSALGKGIFGAMAAVEPAMLESVKQKLLDLKSNVASAQSNLRIADKASTALAPIPDPADDAKKANLESYYSLQDTLAKNAANFAAAQAEEDSRHRIELLERYYDIQETRANAYQKDAIRFEREMVMIEERRQEAKLKAQLDVQRAQSSVAGGVPGAAKLPGSISGRLDASGQNGADMPVGSNNAIQSYHNGIVKALGTAGKNGNYIVIDFIDDLGNRLEATYSHVAAAVKVGQSVVGGQSIGRFDASGRTTGPHNSIDINSLGNNGSLQSGRETSAARRSADILVAGGVQGQVPGSAGMAAAPVPASQKRDAVAVQSTLQASIAKTASDRRSDARAAQEQITAFEKYRAAAFPITEQDMQNKLLTKRNELFKSGMTDERIDQEVKLYENQERGAAGLAALDRLLTKKILTDTQYKALTKELNQDIANQNNLLQQNASLVGQSKFDQALKGVRDRLDMARALTPEAEMRTRLQQQGYAGAQLETLFETEKTTVKAEELKTQMQGVASTIGDAFSTAFQGIINGSVSAQEALGNFFQSVGQSFVKMAMDIIAKQMVMIVLGFIMKALGLSSGGGLGSAKDNMAKYAPLPAAANGAIFSNGIAKFANGGIVNGPTLFPFADGGAMQMGLMGEAGPEAIMPLQRGADGSLGVRAAMGGNGMGGSSSSVLNMSFETSTINGVEYVSRDQLEAAMMQTRRQASSDGAKRGMAMTLDKIQQSPQTRRRIGM